MPDSGSAIATDYLPTLKREIWNDWPDAGVCVALNHELKAIDIDTDDPDLIKAILAALPDPDVKKRGSKGYTAYYRGSDAIVSKPFSIGKNRVLDLLAYGRQTVMPPTIHPDTGQPYRWLGSETLETVAIEYRPVLPDNIAELLAAALAPFGYEPEDEHHRLVAGDGENYWREVNDTALKNLSAWVPDLRIKGTKKHGQGYRDNGRVARRRERKRFHSPRRHQGLGQRRIAYPNRFSHACDRCRPELSDELPLPNASRLALNPSTMVST